MKPHIRGGKVLLIGGRVALVGCPEDCCGPPDFPPWPPGDRPPWFDDSTPPAPTTGECPTNCVGCGDCTPPCNPRPDGLYVRCCKPENPTQIVIRHSQTWESNLSTVGPPAEVRQEIVTINGTRTIIPGVSDTSVGTFNRRLIINGVTVVDTTIDFVPSDEPCPIKNVIVFGPPNTLFRLCYGAATISGDGSGGGPDYGLPGTYARAEYSDCRRGYFSHQFNGANGSGDTATVFTQAFKQITFTPDPCTTPRLCDPATNGGFIP